jgi:hypothetical protein
MAYILNVGSYLLGCNFKGLLSQLLDMKIMLPEFIEKLPVKIIRAGKISTMKFTVDAK